MMIRCDRQYRRHCVGDDSDRQHGYESGYGYQFYEYDLYPCLYYNHYEYDFVSVYDHDYDYAHADGRDQAIPSLSWQRRAIHNDFRNSGHTTPLLATLSHPNPSQDQDVEYVRDLMTVVDTMHSLPFE